ncbi:MAG: PLP-dependent transferase, partial [Vicinamibacterales bacterium]
MSSASRSQDTISAWLDPAGCPGERPPLDAMAADTRALHTSLDAHARRAGVPYLHPDDPTVQVDLFGSARVTAWQEAKAACLFATDASWSELEPLYGRYGTTATKALVARVKALEQASTAIVCDSGMQATALVFDVLMTPGAHAILFGQVYNKTRVYIEWLTERLGGAVTLVEDGDIGALVGAIRPTTRLVFGETFTNPLVRAKNLGALREAIASARHRAPGLTLALDSTVATPWAITTPLLDHGVQVVVASGTKALSGSDRDLWGYVATRDSTLGNAVMDLVAMRGGILDWRRATAILGDLELAEGRHARRSDTASRV